MARIGTLRERVTLQSRGGTPDAYGGTATSWTTVATIWARVTPISGRERLAAQQLEAPIDCTVTIRYRAGVTATHRLLWKGEALNIRSVRNQDEKNIFLTLDCEMGVA